MIEMAARNDKSAAARYYPEVCDSAGCFMLWLTLRREFRADVPGLALQFVQKFALPRPLPFRRERSFVRNQSASSASMRPSARMWSLIAW